MSITNERNLHSILHRKNVCEQEITLRGVEIVCQYLQGIFTENIADIIKDWEL